jgi:hypothetical protein
MLKNLHSGHTALREGWPKHLHGPLRKGLGERGSIQEGGRDRNLLQRPRLKPKPTEAKRRILHVGGMAPRGCELNRNVTRKLGQNLSAQEAIQDLQHVFREVDRDKSGWIDEKELYNLFKKINVVLSDPVEDVRSIFMIMDEQRLGRISCDAFCAVFEVRRACMQQYGTWKLWVVFCCM